MQRGSFQWMKSLNKSIIINKIRTEGPISRAQIAKDTELTPPTVGSIVKELLEQDLVKESQLGTSQGGRKPTMLILNTKAFYILGIDVGPEDILFILSDLSGEVIDEDTQTITEALKRKSFLALLTNGIDGLIAKHPSKELMGIGVAMHGIVDASEGVAVFAPNLQLRNIPIKQYLEEKYNQNVKVENDAKALALGEAWLKNETPDKNMIAVNIGRGIGAGIVIDGKLYHGEHGIAGEIGHMTIDPNGKRCSCGNDGCLQTIAAGPSIAERANELIRQGQSSLLAEWSLEDLTGEMVHRAAKKGDVLATQVLYEAGQYIGIALTNLIHICNPSKIIIGGGVSKAGDYILEPIREMIQTKVISQEAQQTSVQISELGEYGSAMGAVALILSEMFEPNLNN
ncbi:ROK family protein [Saliterribacillus persicus]|uniref:MarR family transcriptional regulator n=1 Tax=Saliterribacillus persicus TaxID=930114 RepID=A0A368X8H6_9BACI|nr:ROK family transcriptional regulator [Saliterribacillus persicus]RCW64260.1 MarR family transcriptional regulator [Saliterribacillus persicus]